MKSYFANSVEAAIAQARRELGPDAVLVTSRATAFEAAALGQYEVVFASDTLDAPSRSTSNLADRTAAATPPPMPVDALLDELRELRREFELLRHTSAQAGDQPRWIAGETALENAFADLMGAEVGRDLGLQLIASLHRRLRPAGTSQTSKLDPARVQAALAEEIQNSFRVDSSLGVDPDGPAVVALVGPPGAGKTAMIAKLAVQYGLARSRTTVLISLDTLRVAASEQLRWYASILGIPFQVAVNNLALAQALKEQRNKQLILIDTPGFTVRDLEEGCEAADFLARRPEIQKHLVLPATLRPSDLARISDAYRAFDPSRLVFTRMDEAGIFGPVLSEAVRSNFPISFFGCGQRVPEDLEPAEKDALANRILPAREWLRASLSAA